MPSSPPTDSSLTVVIALKTVGRHYRHNIGRADILFASLGAFAKPGTIERVMVVVPSDEVQETEGYAKHWSSAQHGNQRIEVVDESQYLRAFSKYKKPHEVRPWHRQQIIKLMAAEVVPTEYFLVLDPDMFATKPFSREDLIREGRAVMEVGPKSVHPEWWQASASLLKLPCELSGDGLRVTPAILSKTICAEIKRTLEDAHGKEWFAVLLEHYDIDWTEYTLYHTVAEAKNLLERHHVIVDPTDRKKLHNDVAIWTKKDAQSFDAAVCFSPETKGLFSVIQSNTEVSPSDIVRWVKPYLPVTMQTYDSRRDLLGRAVEVYGAVRRRLSRRLKQGWMR